MQLDLAMRSAQETTPGQLLSTTSYIVDNNTGGQWSHQKEPKASTRVEDLVLAMANGPILILFTI